MSAGTQHQLKELYEKMASEDLKASKKIMNDYTLSSDPDHQQNVIISLVSHIAYLHAKVHGGECIRETLLQEAGL